MISHTRTGSGTPVVCLHGWPGDASDYRALVPLLADAAEVVVPDLLGFGASYTPADADRPASDFGRDAQVAAVLELMDALALPPAVLVGYDVGSTTSIAIARQVPERVRALVLGNPVHPGAARLALALGPAGFVGYDVGATTASAIAREHPDRVRGLVLGNAITPDAARYALDDDHRAEFWYQDFHQLALVSSLVDGSPRAVRAYLEHFWSYWGARSVATLTDELVDAYSRPGAFTVSVNWYRSGSATVATALALRSGPDPAPVAVPTRVVWGELDPLFPPSLATGLESAYTDLRDLVMLPDVGHFVPLEAARETADAVRALLP